jgi:hypothetical protein
VINITSHHITSHHSEGATTSFFQNMKKVTITFKIQYDDGSEKTQELGEPLVLPQGATGLCFGTVPMLGDGPAALGLDGNPVYTNFILDC